VTLSDTRGCGFEPESQIAIQISVESIREVQRARRVEERQVIKIGKIDRDSAVIDDGDRVNLWRDVRRRYFNSVPNIGTVGRS